MIEFTGKYILGKVYVVFVGGALYVLVHTAANNSAGDGRALDRRCLGIGDGLDLQLEAAVLLFYRPSATRGFGVKKPSKEGCWEIRSTHVHNTFSPSNATHAPERAGDSRRST